LNDKRREKKCSGRCLTHFLIVWQGSALSVYQFPFFCFILFQLQGLLKKKLSVLWFLVLTIGPFLMCLLTTFFPLPGAVRLEEKGSSFTLRA